MVIFKQNDKHCTWVNSVVISLFSVIRVPINKQVCVLYVQKIIKTLGYMAECIAGMQEKF